MLSCSCALLFGALSLVSCADPVEPMPSARVVGVLVPRDDADDTAVHAAISLANLAGLLPGAPLGVSTRSLEEATLADQLLAFSNDRRVQVVVSLLDSEYGPETRSIAAEEGLLVISSVGSEWWDAALASETEDAWFYGLMHSTVGSVAALTQFTTDGKVVCPSLGVVLRGSENDRSGDIAIMKVLVAQAGVAWGGASYVSLGGEDALDVTWSEWPACVLGERGTHLQVAVAGHGRASTNIFYSSLRGVDEFEPNPAAIEYLQGGYRLVGTNGPTDMRDVEHFELLYGKNSGGQLPHWSDQHAFDASLLGAMIAITVPERAFAPRYYRLSASEDEDSFVDVNAQLYRMPTVLATAMEKFSPSRNPDYRGATGLIDYLPAQPIPRQTYRLDRIVNFVTEEFEAVGSLPTRRSNMEYEVSLSQQ